MGALGRRNALLLASGLMSWAVAAGCAGAAVKASAARPAAKAVASASVATSAPAAEPPATAPAAIADPCVAAEAVTNAAIAQADAAARVVMDGQLASGTYKGEMPKLPLESFEVSSWLSCIKTQGGAWAIVLSKGVLSPRTDDDWTAEWVLDGVVALAHVDRFGAVAVAEARLETQSGGGNAHDPFSDKALYLNCCDWVFGGLEPMELFDFDGDGEPEVHVGASYGHEGVHERSDRIFTFQDGRVVPYAPAAEHGFEAMRDVTGDGIPDLLMAQGLSGSEQCGSGFPGDGSGMTFIAHALPGGGFSKVDAEARAFAKAACPKRPAAIQTLDDIHCARLWGVSEAKLELQVRAQFIPWDCDAEMAGRPQKPNARGEYELMLSATKARVPFTLP